MNRKESDFEPDAQLRCDSARLPSGATHVPDPMILVEVLSPDSGTRDRSLKLRAYFQLSTVQHYLTVWPEEQRIVRHSCLPDDGVATTVFQHGDIQLDPPGITVAVEEF